MNKKFIHQVTCVSDKFGLMKNKQTTKKQSKKPARLHSSLSFPSPSPCSLVRELSENTDAQTFK